MTQTAIVPNRDKFLTDFGTICASGVGVIMVRTREPFRAMEAIREWTFAKDRVFRAWTMLHGWQTFSKDDPEADPQCDGDTDILNAMKAVGGLSGSSPFPDGVYCMMWPHWTLKDSRIPPLVQCLAEYARLFAETKIRLVLVTPGEFELPTELQDVITMLDFDPPNRPELIELYRHMINDSLRDPETRPNFNNEEVDRIVAAGSGLTALEFENALGRAIIINRHDLPNVEVEKVFEVILSVKTEAVKRSQVLELMPTVTMDEVGGLDILKEWVRKRRACFTQEFKEFSNNDKVNGIAAIGPPGTGKSLVAKAIGNSLGVPCVRFDVSRVFQSLVGSSEARVRSTLKLVEAMAPCVCLLDEMDKAFDMNSAGGDSGVGKRVLGAILTFMQESRADIFWVLTANRTEGLPSEMLRKGRLDEVFSVTLPTEEERDAILRIHIQKRNQRIPRDLSKAVEASSGYVAAELEAAVREAVMEAYHAGSTVTGELIKAQLQYMKPLSEAFAEQFASMEQWAINNARNASTGARQATVRTRSRSRMAGGKSEGLDLDS